MGGAATGRRRLAVLVLLAAAGERGPNREAIAALLRPNRYAAQSRHSLAHTLYETRHALHCEELLLGPTKLRLNIAHIATDAQEFEFALQSRQLERAVSLYQGPFAEGLSLEGSDELQHWVDALRARYALRATRARTPMRSSRSPERREREAIARQAYGGVACSRRRSR